MAAGDRHEPFVSHWFKVELDFQKMGIGPVELNFRSCTGLKSETAVVDLDEGGFNNTTRKLIGKTKYPNIVLKHGFYHSESVLWKARQKFQLDIPGPNTSKTIDSGMDRGRILPNRFSGKITLMGPDGAEASFGFANAFICKWEGPDLDATKNEVAVESIEIAHEGLFVIPTASSGGGGQSGSGQSGQSGSGQSGSGQSGGTAPPGGPSGP